MSDLLMNDRIVQINKNNQVKKKIKPDIHVKDYVVKKAHLCLSHILHIYLFF